MSENKSGILDFVTQCFNDEYQQSFNYLMRTKQEEFEKLFFDIRENFIEMNLVAFFNQAYVNNTSKLFNNRNGDDLTISDKVFVSFMENFTNATLTKMKLYYGMEKASEIYEETCTSVASTLSEQFNKKVPFYDERFVDGVAISSTDIKELLLSVPMLCFYYLILINFINTEMYKTNLLFGDKLGAMKKRR